MNKLPCFHCGSDILESPPTLFVELENESKPVCCNGCKAVSEHILSNGLKNYYDFRSELASKPSEEIDKSAYAVYADIDYLNLIAEQSGEKHKITLSVENIHCAACAWLIEQALADLDGLYKVNVNTINQRATIEWNNNSLKLSEILSRFAEVGYPATPFKVSDTETILKNKEKQYIKRLGVAGLFTMQVMMLAVAMYFGAFESMESHQVGYFKWISFLLSMPVVLYSAFPFAQGAIASIKSKKLNMDVPVSIAIYGAFIASLYQLISHGLDGDQGEVFFESISMFTFLLLIGKYLEFRAKSKAILSNSNLSATLPATAVKIIDGNEQTVLVKDLNINDVIIIKAGEHIAVDGIIIEGESQINESVLTGEFNPVSKKVNDSALAGSINSDGIIKVKVTATGEQTTLSQINNIQQEFSEFKPAYSQFADTIAHWFVFAQLIISLATYLYWHINRPDDALWIALSVLVATCPCALSLATPTAYTCVLSTLSKAGVLIKDAIAFDRINQITTLVFDKTGTLSEGKFKLDTITWFEENFIEKLSLMELKGIVYLLERQSEHPLAKAFSKEALALESYDLSNMKIEGVKVFTGQGILGFYNGLQIKIGSAAFCQTENNNLNIHVTVEGKLAGSFKAKDGLKYDALPALTELKSMDKKLVALTGDSSHSATEILANLPLDYIKTGCSPEDKANHIRQLQSDGEHVFMIGDGINDAPVLAVSDVSLAMGSGADITKQAADIIIVRNALRAVLDLFKNAQKTRRIIKQNLYWALLYNVTILPVAMMGLVPPYIAVIGMSASSIIVVSNSLRLLK